MHLQTKTLFQEFTSTSMENQKKDTRKTILISLAFLIFILLNLNEVCYATSFKTIQDKIKKNDICEIDYNSFRTAAIVNIDCGSAIYINFKTKQTYTIVKHWPNVWSRWLTENLAHITGPCGTGCSQSIIFVAPATIISCPIHGYRITSLSPDEFPDFYNNNPLLIEPNKRIYVCYSSRNDIQVFKLPKQLQTEIHPPKGYYAEKAIIRYNKLLILYKNANDNIKKIFYGINFRIKNKETFE